MSGGIQFLCYSAASGISGMALLHLTSSAQTDGSSRSRSLAPIAFLLAGALLALPFFFWTWSLLGQRSPKVSPSEVLLLAGYLAAAFFWFVWNLNAYAFQAPGSFANPWEENWGSAYSLELKRKLLGPLFEQLESQGKIGDLVVDVGSGASPVSGLLRRTAERRFIRVDIAASDWGSLVEQNIKLDVEKIDRPDSLSYKRALVRVCRFLQIDLRAQGSRRLATTILFSDILNYVDYKRVIGGFAEFLARDGRLIISNLPTRGIRSLFSERGLKDNYELSRYLSGMGSEIEYKDFPRRAKGERDESGELIVLVARGGFGG